MPPTSTPTGIGWHTIPVRIGEPVQLDYEYDEDAPEGEREHILLHYGCTGEFIVSPPYQHMQMRFVLEDGVSVLQAYGYRKAKPRLIIQHPPADPFEERSG